MAEPPTTAASTAATAERDVLLATKLGSSSRRPAPAPAPGVAPPAQPDVERTRAG